MKNSTQLEQSKIIGVYTILNSTGKAYVGMSCKNIEERWMAHYKELKANLHKCTGLQNSYNKRGIEDFTFTILHQWSYPTSTHELTKLEPLILETEKNEWLRLKNEGYSMLHGCPTGTGSVHHSEDTRRKIGLAAKQRTSVIAQRSQFIDNLSEIRILSEQPHISAKEIREKFSINKAQFRLLCREFSVNVRYEKAAVMKKLLEDNSDVIFDLRKSGASAKEIAEVVGVSYPTIFYFLKFI